MTQGERERKSAILTSALHNAARQWAAAGYYVFPCLVGRKEPACQNGLDDATLDAAQIDAWWTENPDYNVGCAPHKSGNTVLDVDGERGVETLAEVQETYGHLPSTLTISTPRAPGMHLWFEGACSSSVGTDDRGLGPKLDTRGEGGYVLMPPSVISPGEYKNNPSGGEYVIKHACEAADLPEWISERIATRRVHHVAGTDDVDGAESVRRVRLALERLVANGDIAVEGSGGDDRTFKMACEVLDLGVSPETGLRLCLELWNPHCQPPWEEDELQTKFDNAANYRQNDAGAYAVKPPAETFAHIALAGEDTKPARRSRFYPLDLQEQATQAEPAWLIPNLLPADGLVVCYGQPKSFKSFLVLDMCLGIAAGEETFGFTPRSRPVVYAAGEGSSNIARKHVPAWRIAKLREDNFPFYVIPCVPRVIEFEQTVELVEQIKARNIQPAVVVIDTVARSAGGLEENSAKDIGTFVAACDYIREQLHCTVIGIHHSGKDGAKGSRGSNALEGAVDTVLEVSRHGKSSTVALKVKEQRSAQEREEPYTFIGKVVGPSLVFQPITLDEYTATIEADKLITHGKVGMALQRLGAYGYEAGVSTAVLVAELGRDLNIGPAALTKELHKARKHDRSIAMLADGDPLRWHLMAPADNGKAGDT